MDGVVCAATVWIWCFLVWEEGRWGGSFACVRACAGYYVPAFFSFFLFGVADTMIPSFASVKIYTLSYLLCYSLYIHTCSLHNPDHKV